VVAAVAAAVLLLVLLQAHLMAAMEAQEPHHQ
jgi:hypothetical protein